MNRILVSWKKFICVTIFSSLAIFSGYSQTSDRFDINFDSFEYTKEFEDKVELYKKSYTFYELTIEQILADEKAKQEIAIEKMRSKIYAEEVEKVRLEETSKIHQEVVNELTPVFEQKKKEEVEKIEDEIKSTYENEFNKNKETYKQEVRDSLLAEYEEKKNSEVAAEKEKLKSEYDEKYKIDSQTFLAEKSKELEESFEQKKNDEVKKLSEELRLSFENEFESKKESYITSVKAELEPKYEEKKNSDVVILVNQFKDSFTSEKRNELKEELAIEYEQKKNIEVSAIEQTLQEKYELEFNAKSEEFINRAKIFARSEMDSEYKQKLIDYEKEVTPKLKEQAYVDTKAATERFKTLALYTFLVVILLICIISVITVKTIKNVNKKKAEMEAKRQDAEENAKKKAEEDARIAAQEAADKEKKVAEESRKQKKAELSLLTQKHYEFLKNSNGDKAACIDYFKEHYPDCTLDNVLEYQAYKKAVEMYEHPTLVMEEGE